MNRQPYDRLDYFKVCEVSDGRYCAGHIFKEKLGGVLPDYGRHIIALYKHDLCLITLGYLNILEHDGVALVGGGCVYGKAFTDVSAAHRAAIRETGGVLFCMLRYAFTEMADDYQAFFGYCGDKRAEEVDLQAGFRHSGHPNLLVHFHRDGDPARQEQLTRKVIDLGPF